MKYIDSVYIDGFRGFKDFKLSNLKDINFIVGENNTGKTSLMEAINILEYPGEIGHFINVLRQREGFDLSTPFHSFENSLSKNNFNGYKNVQIEAIIKNKSIICNVHVLPFETIKSGSFKPKVKAFEGFIAYEEIDFEANRFENKLYIDEETDRLKVTDSDSFSPIKMTRVMPFDHVDKEIINGVIKKGKKSEIIEVIKLFDKDIIGIETIQEENGVKTYIQHKTTGMLPISAYGDGLKKVIYLSSGIINTKEGVLLIDEIETAIHYNALKEVFEWIIEAANRYKVQIFATTHSSEALDALMECAMGLKGEQYLKESINIITLKKGDDYYHTKVRVLDGLEAYKFREDFNMELRG
ncbi:AAA family ATPase [Proteiniborus sp. MB09-C3]|uniref:AAA family ATPase n=1 Tax=Proteiniborus sp. MB09-C3 TaxID=3050072 RepID=UPI00255212C8|nr:AAA family ATPase [Proteiniborus sp. MB09-C3]WIV13283.1 AAA family ATPase [Proteiniborus sp. MB09-C3]